MAPRDPDAVPDVTVVLAVYDTMPYLTECLDSVLAQTIGHERLEVVAVDDGSTDGSGEELDACAAAHPGLVRVVHQQNSGGPAGPNNVALDLARGRWVIFVGADDHLGPEALERMVGYGDAHAADVVLGRVEGVNGRYVPQALYGRDHVDVDPFGPHLRWTIANSKLFRRAHVEDLGLRYREDMRVGTDQPFTIRACLAARRIAVVGTYPCYYAVRREDRSNVTYSIDVVTRARATEKMMAAVAEVMPSAVQRDHYLVRHFTWEVQRLLPADQLADWSSEQREQGCAAVRDLVERWYTPAIDRALGVRPRVRLRLAAAGEIEEVLALDAVEGAGGPPVLLEEALAFLAYPAFRTDAAARAGLTDTDFALTPAAVATRLRDGLEVGEVTWTDDLLTADVRVPALPATSRDHLRAWLRPAGKEPAGRPRRRPGKIEHLADQAAADAGWVRVVVPRGEAEPSGWRLFLGGRVEAGDWEVRVPLPTRPDSATTGSQGGSGPPGGREILGRLARRLRSRHPDGR